MNRRSFFSALAAIAATAALDPERLLWRPGAKLISIPQGPRLIDPHEFLHLHDMITIAGYYAVNPVTGKEVPGVLQWYTVVGYAESSVELIPAMRIRADSPEIDARLWNNDLTAQGQQQVAPATPSREPVR